VLIGGLFHFIYLKNIGNFCVKIHIDLMLLREKHPLSVIPVIRVEKKVLAGGNSFK